MTARTMRSASLRLTSSLCLLLSLMACPGDDGGGSGTDTDAATGTGSTGSTGGMDETADSGEGSTGEPAVSELVPCDPLVEGSCEDGVCAGSPTSGFFCRPGCSSMAEEGTPCGSDDVCLPVIPGAEQTACFDVADCDFVTGSGCNEAAGETCVVVTVEPLRTACVPTGDTGVGQPCDPTGTMDCAPGLACLGSDLETGADGLCTGWCEPGAPLPPSCPMCAALGDAIGTCTECTVLDDTCPDGSQCQLVNELLGGICVGVGPGGPGSPCSPFDAAQSCQEGLLCLDLDDAAGDQSVCVEACEPGRSTCSDEAASCVDVDLFVPGAPSGQLGVCLSLGVQVCDPTGEPTGCDPGDNCLDVGGGIGICGASCDPTTGAAACEGNSACFPSSGMDIEAAPFVEGNGACGVGCSIDDDCGGATCLHLDGIEVDGLCGATCTPGMPGTCPGGSSCVATPEDPGVGACMPGGTACNPGNLGDCGAAACIPMEGETTIGICLAACFEQDPVACGGMPAMCQVKTDPRWHEGTCIGGGEPCTLVPDSCGPGQSCGVIGGQAFGGQAFLCDDAGPLSEGGDCSMDSDACGAGLGCIDGTCRVWCDPAAPACVTGSCVDLSLGLYMAPGTIGACL
ncbi:MAG: hypothetical protein H6712_33600 [Myxococcales bacterium]|nr:hypothetical protein [Myxococcales bacterium]MCB9718829.1 hypothetical protein [Myxococcales bacterium]